MPFAATRIDLESIILSEVSQRRQISQNICGIFYVESKKNDTNELIYKTETDSQRK